MHATEQAYSLQFVLPKLLLPRLVQEGEIADMVHKDISEQWQFRVLRLDLACIGFKRRTESLQRCW